MTPTTPRFKYDDGRVWLLVPFTEISVEEFKCFSEAYVDGDLEAVMIPTAESITLSEALQRLPVIA
jgi:hypothetical protein